MLLPPGLPSYPDGRGDVLVLWCLAFSAGQGMYVSSHRFMRLARLCSREQTTDPILAEFAVTLMTIGSPFVHERRGSKRLTPCKLGSCVASNGTAGLDRRQTSRHASGGEHILSKHLSPGDLMDRIAPSSIKGQTRVGSSMQIRTYEEVDPREVFRLTMLTFGWRLTPDLVRHFLRRDPATVPGYAFYAVETGHVMAQAVPMLMNVRLTTGVEQVGGVAGVCSLPSVWGRGYARRLMTHTHGFFREQGVGLSTLTTSRNIRGYRIYRRMGYVDLARLPLGVRSLSPRTTRPAGVGFRKVRRDDLPRLQTFFAQYVRGHLGWTERDPRRLACSAAWDSHVLDRYRMVMRNGRPVGYVHRSSGGWTHGAEVVVSEETIVPVKEDFRATVRALEAKAKGPFAAVDATGSRRDQGWYRSLGYRLDDSLPATVMALPLDGRRPKDAPRLFGGPQGKFVMHATDWF